MKIGFTGLFFLHTIAVCCDEKDDQKYKNEAYIRDVYPLGPLRQEPKEHRNYPQYCQPACSIYFEAFFINLCTLFLRHGIIAGK